MGEVCSQSYKLQANSDNEGKIQLQFGGRVEVPPELTGRTVD